jgi:copper chaperone
VTKTTVFTVPEVHCGHCKASLEGALGPTHGVEQAEVDLSARTVTVSYDAEAVGPPKLVEVIEDQGYDVESFQEAS